MTHRDFAIGRVNAMADRAFPALVAEACEHF
jgi:hypothetical protein